MKDNCIAAVTKAAGRTLTQAELKNIEDRIVRNQRILAQTDREAYLSLTPEQRVQEAAKMAKEKFLADAAKKKQRVALTIQKHDRIDSYIKSQKTKHGMNSMDSLQRLLAVYNDGKSNTQSVESRGNAIANDYVRQLVDTFESVQPKIFGLFKNKIGTEALVRSLFGEDLKGKFDPEISKAAKDATEAWDKVTEEARKHFNNAGGDIGRIEDWRMPQNHSQMLIAKAGQEAWLKDMMGWYNPKRYTKEDGSYMTATEVNAILKNAWLTIATGGANKIEEGRVVGRGMLANAHADERAIHFKDADSYMAYQQKYGALDPYTTMMAHIKKLSGDIALLETMGPNPDLQFKYWLDKSIKEDSIATPTESGKITAKAVNAQNLYDYISGRTKPVANKKIAEGFDTLRNWLIATRLGSAYVTSIADNATMHLTAAVNNMSHMQLLRNQLATLNLANPDELRIARRAGLSLNALMGDMNRWGNDNIAGTFSSKMANLTLRASLLNAATEARRRAFGTTMYGSIGSTVNKSKSLADVDVGDKRILEARGVTDTDFKVWKEASLEDWGNGNDMMLTPESIYRIPDDKLKGLGDPKTLKRDAALKLLGTVNDETNMAIIETGARERVLTKVGTQRGTWKGEIARSFFLFKSFPIAMIMKHWARGLNMDTKAAKAMYIGSFMAGTTILGAAAAQISNVLAGRDPQDMTKGGFWASAAMKGGSLGIYGDFLLSNTTAYGSSPLATLAGPVAGYLEDVIGLTQGMAIKAAKGEKTNSGAEAIKFLKSNIPLQNLWYTKAITDRLIFNQLQEMVSPGYMRRVEQRAKKEFNQSHFWRPGQVAPNRGPDLGRAIGQ